MDTKMISRLHTLHDIDSKITAPFWGYESLEAYLSHASSSQDVENVKVPLLAINACDDPFVSKEALGKVIYRASRNPRVILVTTNTGGHIGWGESLGTLWNESWAERLAVDFLDTILVLERIKNAKMEEGEADRQEGDPNTITSTATEQHPQSRL